MGLKGKIFINPFGIPKQSVEQAERIKYELFKLGVSAEISLTYFRAGVNLGGLECDEKLDFAVYLDKDKYLSLMLEALGVRVFNKHAAIRVCDDKAETYIALKKGDFNMPKTAFAPLCYRGDLPVPNGAVSYIEREIGYPVVVKQSFGSMGKGVFLAKDRGELIALLDELKTTSHFYQEYIGLGFGLDIRVIVIGGKAVAAMKRINETDFRSNVAVGGRGEKIELDDKSFIPYIKEAERAAKLIDLDYCGVDLLMGKNDTPVICEVNSNAFFGEIEKVSSVNVAKAFAEHIINTVK